MRLPARSTANGSESWTAGLKSKPKRPPYTIIIDAPPQTLKRGAARTTLPYSNQATVFALEDGSTSRSWRTGRTYCVAIAVYVDRWPWAPFKQTAERMEQGPAFGRQITIVLTSR